MPRYKHQQTSFRFNPHMQMPDMRGMDEMSYSQAINMSQQSQKNDMQMRGMQRDEWRDEAAFEQQREDHEWMQRNSDLSRKLISEFDPTDPDLDAKMMQLDPRTFKVPGANEMLSILGRARDNHNRKQAKQDAFDYRRDDLEYQHSKKYFDSTTAIAYNAAKSAKNHELAAELWAKGEKERERDEADILNYKRQQDADKATRADKKIEAGATKAQIASWQKDLDKETAYNRKLREEKRKNDGKTEAPHLEIEQSDKKLAEIKARDPRTKNGSKAAPTKIPNSIMDSAAQ